ncbi:MAG: DUF4377 domain-containing protein [Moraxella sp.]|nr:DUF4377 domain-containing protein [Moraxella sp.]
MKKFALMALAGSLVLAGCSSMPLDDKRTMVIEGEKVEVQIQNIRSFEVEIAPRKAVCQITDTLGNKVDSECLQYRRTFERNFNTLSGDIKGFEYEAGHRYVLDVKQTALLNEATGKVVPEWSLNKIISKTAE